MTVEHRLHLRAFVQPCKHRVRTEDPIQQRLLAAVRGGEVPMPDEPPRAADRPGEQRVCLFLGDAPPDVLHPLLYRDAAVEGDDQQPALHTAIEPAAERRQDVGREDVLRHGAELDPALVDIAPLDGFAGDDGLECNQRRSPPAPWPSRRPEAAAPARGRGGGRPRSRAARQQQKGSARHPWRRPPPKPRSAPAAGTRAAGGPRRGRARAPSGPRRQWRSRRC